MIPLLLILGWVLLSLFVGVMAGIKRKFTLEGYLVSERGLGLLFLYVLMAGEIYSAYAFLGTAGWAFLLPSPSQGFRGTETPHIFRGLSSPHSSLTLHI